MGAPENESETQPEHSALKSTAMKHIVDVDCSPYVESRFTRRCRPPRPPSIAS